MDSSDFAGEVISQSVKTGNNALGFQIDLGEFFFPLCLYFLYVIHVFFL